MLFPVWTAEQFQLRRSEDEDAESRLPENDVVYV